MSVKKRKAYHFENVVMNITVTIQMFPNIARNGALGAMTLNSNLTFAT